MLPRFKHNCLHCIFLGVFNEYDLYGCPKNKTILARFGNNEIDYVSGYFNKDAVVELNEAYKRACKLLEFQNLGWQIDGGHEVRK